ncbi:hypothetical protein JOD43_001882 [Pullulanibacillus pueri]|uniref:Uncharacterized protein n=1 Tax=Pullulanibacillus pueri TaxID=1437324 RepID=A0A8J2ZZ62_9BACL|nr:hypothetical protein [Pullulanibacillus pueri]MBM7681710.1 hypothetical protein [Pullulanibacillus pueri]GGH87085.1 hypothetical protein GCM10007096_36290 [Pullulanibacillus pueri]
MEHFINETLGWRILRQSANGLVILEILLHTKYNEAYSILFLKQRLLNETYGKNKNRYHELNELKLF